MRSVEKVADLKESCREMYAPRRFISSATSSMAPWPPPVMDWEKAWKPAASAHTTMGQGMCPGAQRGQAQALESLHASDAACLQRNIAAMHASLYKLPTGRSCANQVQRHHRLSASIARAVTHQVQHALSPLVAYQISNEHRTQHHARDALRALRMCAAGFATRAHSTQCPSARHRFSSASLALRALGPLVAHAWPTCGPCSDLLNLETFRTRHANGHARRPPPP